MTADGWSVEDRPPILFRHHHHQAIQVEPRRDGSMEPLLDLINIRDPGSRLLVKVYLVAALLPLFPLPILIVYGEHGSAKSTLFKLLRVLLDPSTLGTLASPDNLREFVQLASHHRTVYLDNLSHLPDWLSDALCRLCTGEGFSKRELYTDDDDVVYNLRGLGGINGINLAATKPDLLDRAIILKLEPIPEDKRRTEAALWAGFEEMHPLLLGAVLDALAWAMRLYPNVKLQRHPRLADFARWGVAIAEALGHKGNEFLDAYRQNVATQNDAALQESPVAQAVLGFVQLGQTWQGTATELLTALEGAADDLHVNIRKAVAEGPQCPFQATTGGAP